jgi:hypothetical protein
LVEWAPVPGRSVYFFKSGKYKEFYRDPLAKNAMPPKFGFFAGFLYPWLLRSAELKQFH